MLLFGDLYAKGGRPGDAVKAQTWYDLAVAQGEGWSFRALAEDRALHVDQRMARYRDAARSNDPPIVGTARENCAFCHNR